MSPLVGIPALLAEFGLRPAAVLEGLPVDLSIFESPETRIPYSVACRLVQNCVERTGCPHFGLLLGSRADHGVLGPAGEWMRNAPNLGACLTGFAAMQPSASRGGVVYVFSSHDVVYFGYGIYGRRAEGWQHLYPLVVAMAHNVVQKLTVGAAQPTEVLLSVREPEDRKPYHEVFRAPVLFNQPMSALVYPRQAMELPIVGASPVDFSELERKAAALMPPGQHVWTDRVKRVLRSLILEAEPVSATVAERLQVSDRTLRRHLAREGTTFQAVLDDLRFASARELLEVTTLSVGEIALALSYSTHSAFDDAFRRWSGTTPQRWRSAAAGR
ncbi:MAG: AraC family transcriptional regulator ligand-binding domain-containing protein [Alsobacter sp.]